MKRIFTKNMGKLANTIIIIFLLASCNADNPTNSADSPDNMGPDTGWSGISDYSRGTVTDDTMPGIKDTVASPAGQMPVK